MENITPEQKKKLERLLEVEKGGNVGILKYLYDLEDKIDTEIPNIKTILSQVKGEKGDTPTQEEIFSMVQKLMPVLEDGVDGRDGVDGEKGEKGERGRDGKDGKDGRDGRDGRDGKDADELKIVQELEKDLPQFGEQFRDGLELLRGEERLDKSAVKGLEDYEEISKLAREPKTGGVVARNLYQMGDVNIQSPTNNQVLKYNSSNNLWENGTGGGSGGGHTIQDNGVDLTQRTNLNFVGATVTDDAGNDATVVTIESGLAEIAITGTIDDSNVTFTSATQPDILVINGGVYAQTGGAITWTYLAGTITLSSPVGTGGSIFGLTTDSSASVVYPYIPTGTVNGSNTAFTATSNAPKSIVADGVTYFTGNGYTLVGLDITMDIAPTAYIYVTA